MARLNTAIDEAPRQPSKQLVIDLSSSPPELPQRHKAPPSPSPPQSPAPPSRRRRLIRRNIVLLDSDDDEAQGRNRKPMTLGDDHSSEEETAEEKMKGSRSYDRRGGKLSSLQQQQTQEVPRQQPFGQRPRNFAADAGRSGFTNKTTANSSSRDKRGNVSTGNTLYTCDIDAYEVSAEDTGEEIGSQDSEEEDEKGEENQDEYDTSFVVDDDEIEFEDEKEEDRLLDDGGDSEFDENYVESMVQGRDKGKGVMRGKIIGKLEIEREREREKWIIEKERKGVYDVRWRRGKDEEEEDKDEEDEEDEDEEDTEDDYIHSDSSSLGKKTKKYRENHLRQFIYDEAEESDCENGDSPSSLRPHPRPHPRSRTQCSPQPQSVPPKTLSKKPKKEPKEKQNNDTPTTGPPQTPSSIHRHRRSLTYDFEAESLIDHCNGAILSYIPPKTKPLVRERTPISIDNTPSPTPIPKPKSKPKPKQQPSTNSTVFPTISSTPARHSKILLPPTKHITIVPIPSTPRTLDINPFHPPTRSTTSLRNFQSRKVILADTFLDQLDILVTNNRIAKKLASLNLPPLRVIWSKNLLTTAGIFRFNYKISLMRPVDEDGEYLPGPNPRILTAAHIELAEKVVDDEDRLYSTLAHEFAHVADTVLGENYGNGEGSGRAHGKSFKSWLAKCIKAFPQYKIEMGTCHSYVIEYKYHWECIGRESISTHVPTLGMGSGSGCGHVVKRHSKSIDVEIHRCPACGGRLFQILPKPRGAYTSTATTGPTTTTSTTPIEGNLQQNEYITFAKTRMKAIKSENPGMQQKDIMKLVGQEWSLLKKEKKKRKTAQVGCGNGGAGAGPNRSEALKNIDVEVIEILSSTDDEGMLEGNGIGDEYNLGDRLGKLKI